MKKKNIIAIGLIIVVFIIFVFVLMQNNKNNIATGNVQANSLEKELTNKNENVEKIEVVHFHGAHQCYSCLTVGKYALKTIKEKFPKEYKNGKIVYKDINAELPENKDIVMKYQASGSSLFVNAIRNGRDSIEEDTDVWRLISNETQFINYFSNKINKLLGK